MDVCWLLMSLFYIEMIKKTSSILVKTTVYSVVLKDQAILGWPADDVRLSAVGWMKHVIKSHYRRCGIPSFEQSSPKWIHGALFSTSPVDLSFCAEMHTWIRKRMCMFSKTLKKNLIWYKSPGAYLSKQKCPPTTFNNTGTGADTDRA